MRVRPLSREAWSRLRRSIVDPPDRVAPDSRARSIACVLTRSAGCVPVRSAGCVPARSAGCVAARQGHGVRFGIKYDIEAPPQRFQPKFAMAVGIMRVNDEAEKPSFSLAKDIQ